LRGGDMDRPFRSRRLPLDAYNRRVNALIQERGGGGRSVGVGIRKILFPNECFGVGAYVSCVASIFYGESGGVHKKPGKKNEARRQRSPVPV